jgi:hypothetical protein
MSRKSPEHHRQSAPLKGFKSWSGELIESLRQFGRRGLVTFDYGTWTPMDIATIGCIAETGKKQ